MATSAAIIEELIIDENDPHVVANWLERLEQIVEILIFNASANLPTEPAERQAKEDSIRRSYLLSSLGRSSYKLLKSYCTPASPTTKSYDELKTILRQNLAPPINTVSEQYKFNNIRQEVNESLAVFMARIKEAAVNCEFRDNYDMMVRNRFICGIKSEKIRASLLTDSTSVKYSQKLQMSKQCNKMQL